MMASPTFNMGVKQGLIVLKRAKEGGFIMGSLVSKKG